MLNKGFSSVLLLLIILVASVIVVSYLLLPKLSHKITSQRVTDDGLQTLNVGEEFIVMYPGKSGFSLPSGALLTFGHSETPYAVPDFVYGDKYNLNDIHNINYLGINDKLVTYHNGYRYDITNEGCETAERFDIDIMITEVTKCNLKVITKREVAPILVREDYSKSFTIVEKGNSIVGLHSKPGEPLLYGGTWPIRVQKNVTETIYIEPGTNWDIRVITNYGIETIRFTPEELWEKKTKAGTAGVQTISVSIDDLSCGNLGITAKEKCPYFTTIDFTISQNGLVETPVSILEYK